MYRVAPHVPRTRAKGFLNNAEAQWLWENHKGDNVLEFCKQYLLMNIEKDKAKDLPT
jgi:hypothetical protein